MSEMREITTINRNSNSDAFEKLTNGFSADKSPSETTTPTTTTKQYSPTSSTTKSDRNNNNVMKKSMPPPPVPPKKYNRYNVATKTNIIPVDDNRTDTIQNSVINHVHDWHKLSNSSNEDNNGNAKDQCGLLNRLDNVIDCQSDPKIASELISTATTTTSSDNNINFDNDFVATTTESIINQNSGISHQCDNGM